MNVGKIMDFLKCISIVCFCLPLRFAHAQGGVLILSTNIDVPTHVKSSPFEMLTFESTRSAPGTPAMKELVANEPSEKMILSCDHGFFTGQAAEPGLIGGVSVYQFSTNQAGKVLRLYEIWYVTGKSNDGGSILTSENIRVLTDASDLADITVPDFLLVHTVNEGLDVSYYSPAKKGMVRTTLSRCWE